MVRGLLFDFDGLIVDTERSSLASWQELYREHGQELPLDRWATVIGTIGGFDPFTHLDELAGPLDREGVLGRRQERELALADVEELRPGVLDYLEGARELGLATAVVSSSWRGWVDRHLGRLGLAERFDAIVTADGDPERAKPRPTLYLEALDLLGLEAHEAVALEDSPNGVRAARGAGVLCVAVPSSPTRALELGEPDLVLDSLAEVPLRALVERFSAPLPSSSRGRAR